MLYSYEYCAYYLRYQCTHKHQRYLHRKTNLYPEMFVFVFVCILPVSCLRRGVSHLHPDRVRDQLSVRPRQLLPGRSDSHSHAPCRAGAVWGSQLQVHHRGLSDANRFGYFTCDDKFRCDTNFLLPCYCSLAIFFYLQFQSVLIIICFQTIAVTLKQILSLLVLKEFIGN